MLYNVCSLLYMKWKVVVVAGFIFLFYFCRFTSQSWLVHLISLILFFCCWFLRSRCRKKLFVSHTRYHALTICYANVNYYYFDLCRTQFWFVIFFWFLLLLFDRCCCSRRFGHVNHWKKISIFFYCINVRTLDFFVGNRAYFTLYFLYYNRKQLLLLLIIV